MIKIANKKQEENKMIAQNQTKFIIRTEFWKKLLQEMNEQSDVGSTKGGWSSDGSGYSGISYMFVVTGSYARA